MWRTSILLALVVGLLSAGVATADVAFPARLTVEETSPGTYDVTFTLPIVEGRKLRAEPLLPPTCREVTERQIGVSAIGHTTTWTVACDPASLAGEAVLIGGLLGTQTELAFTLSSLDGRTYTGILRPSRPGFLVPSPPVVSDLAARATVGGMRRVVRSIPLWLLVVMAVAVGAGWRESVTAALAFSAGHVAAQWLGGNAWIQVNPLARDLFVLVSAAVPAVGLAGGGERWKGWIEPLWPVMVLVGLLHGGAAPEALPPDGLSNAEQLLVLVVFSVGAGAGFVLLATIGIELRSVFVLGNGGSRWAVAQRLIGYGAGALALGMVVTRVAALALLAGDHQRAPMQLGLLALVLGPSLTGVGWGRPAVVTAFAGLTATGAGLGLGKIPIPGSAVVVTGALLVLGGALAAGRLMPRSWTLSTAAVAAVTIGWTTGSELLENVSRSTGAALGSVLVSACILFAALRLGRTTVEDRPEFGLRLLGAGALVVAVGWRLADYRAWFDGRVATEAALGVIRFPLLAAALLLAALVVWPRRRRVMVELGVERRSRYRHWVLAGLAFLMVPIGSVAIRNPLFSAEAPRGESARRVVSNVLSETYHAFNLADEVVLYDTLAKSVAGELVDDLYLDSRRRLTAGTREGTEVTVREVNVLDIGDPVELADSSSGFAYDCRWVVTARVRHLQHVHHRRNIYNGVLTLRVDDNRWKIARVDLRSEERVVLPWQPT